MSDYEQHRGKLIKLTSTYPYQVENVDEIAKRVLLQREFNFTQFTERTDYASILLEYYSDEYVRCGDDLYQIVDHEEQEDSDDYVHLTEHLDGTLSFETRFYNGATYLSEMLEEALKKRKTNT